MDAITAFQVGSLIVLWLTALNAWRQGHRWLATLAWGVVFGFLVECYNVHCNTAGYYYPACRLGPNPGDGGKTWCVAGVPTWIPIGWGCIVYLSAWTAQRLRISGWAKPVVAAFLAVNLDLTLDPVATHLQFWRWCAPPPSTLPCIDPPHPFYLYGVVPFDNFLGWYIIVFVYTLVARLGLRFVNRRLGEGTGVRNHWLDVILPGVAALLAFGGYLIVRYIATGNKGYQSDSGGIAAMIFIVVSVVAAAITWVSTLRSARDHNPNWAPLVIPALVQVGCFVLALTSGFWKLQPAILVAIPANLVTGLVIFAWPSLESLIPPVARRDGPA
jgi:hypothetical protein